MEKLFINRFELERGKETCRQRIVIAVAYPTHVVRLRALKRALVERVLEMPCRDQGAVRLL